MRSWRACSLAKAVRRNPLRPAEAALALEPRNREANRTLAFVKAAVAGDPAYASSAAGMITDAIRHLEVVLSDSVVDLSAQLLLAKLYSQTGQHEKALSTIRTFLTNSPAIRKRFC
jgi:cytochrome c-type biogenesis protein CcmH/NrfG